MPRQERLLFFSILKKGHFFGKSVFPVFARLFKKREKKGPTFRNGRPFFG